MKIKDLSEDFFDNYGYYPNNDELQSFLEDSNYYDDESIPDNVSNFRTSARRRKSLFDHLDNEEKPDDFYSVFQKLISEISKDAKQQGQKHKPSEHSLELIIMTFVFLNKLSLFFLLKYCDENGIYTNI